MSGFGLLLVTFRYIDQMQIACLQRNFLQMWFVEELHSYGNTIAWQEWDDGTMAKAVKEVGFSLVWT